MMVFIGRREAFLSSRYVAASTAWSCGRTRGRPRPEIFDSRENTDKYTDKMARESRDGKNDEAKVVEAVGCGGGI